MWKFVERSFDLFRAGLMTATKSVKDTSLPPLCGLDDVGLRREVQQSSSLRERSKTMAIETETPRGASAADDAPCKGFEKHRVFGPSAEAVRAVVRLQPLRPPSAMLAQRSEGSLAPIQHHPLPRSVTAPADGKEPVALDAPSSSLRPPRRAPRTILDDLALLARALCPFVCTPAQWGGLRPRLLRLLQKRDFDAHDVVSPVSSLSPLVVLVAGSVQCGDDGDVLHAGHLVGGDSWLFDAVTQSKVVATSPTTAYVLPRSARAHVLALATPESLLSQATRLASVLAQDPAWAGVAPSDVWQRRHTATTSSLRHACEPASVHLVLHGTASWHTAHDVPVEVGTLLVSSSPRALVPSAGAVWVQLTHAEVAELLGDDAACAYVRRCEVEPATGSTSIDEFELLQSLGAGAFASVSLALHRPTSALCALKIIPKNGLPSLKLASQAVTERDVLASVHSPFVARYLDSFQDDWNLYLASEFVQGGELYERVHGPHAAVLDESAVLFYAANVAVALDALHTGSIVYRDLKLENVLLGATGYLKLIDCGFARHVHARAYTLCGTPEYMAPELIAGRGYSLAVDYWALGALVYELATGHSLFARDDENPTLVMARISAVATLGLPLCPEFDVSCSPRLRSLILELLHVDPTQRLGARGLQEVEKHTAFADLNWTALRAQAIAAPYVPALTSPRDTQHFHTVDDQDDALESIESPAAELQAAFATIFAMF